MRESIEQGANVPGPAAAAAAVIGHQVAAAAELPKVGGVWDGLRSGNSDVGRRAEAPRGYLVTAVRQNGQRFEIVPWHSVSLAAGELGRETEGGGHTIEPRSENLVEVVFLSENGVVDLAAIETRTRHDLGAFLGAVARTEVEKVLRASLIERSRTYHDVCQAGTVPTQDDDSFVSGGRVPTGGRIFDATETVRLIDSSLDTWLTAGRFTKQFEERLARAAAARHAYFVNSGSSANLLAFSALTSPMLRDRQLRRGDEVITVAAGFPTTIAPLVQYGAVPVFVDIDVEGGTYNILTSQLEEALSPKTRAIMLAHTLGNPFAIRTVREFCDKHQLWLIEDNCDGLGGEYDGKPTGSFGHISTVSFYPAHQLTTGEGGAVFTSSGRLSRILESLRDWGRDCWCDPGKDNTCGKRYCQQFGTLPEGYDHKYTYSHFGFNFKASDMQAAVGTAQLDKLDRFTRLRRENWRYMRDALADLSPYFILPEPTEHANPSWFGFMLTVRETAPFRRTELVQFLEERNIQTRMLFAGNITRQPCFDQMRREKTGFRVIGDLTGVDWVMHGGFWIGVHPGITPRMRSHAVATIREFVDQRMRGRA